MYAPPLTKLLFFVAAKNVVMSPSSGEEASAEAVFKLTVDVVVMRDDGEGGCGSL